ncbi:MAG: Ig-like domain-containing protein [Chlamydiales bacterium]
MEAIQNQSISNSSLHQSQSCKKYILHALNIIFLIGTLTLMGCFYSQLGYSSIAIGVGGCLVSALVFVLIKSLKNQKDFSNLSHDDIISFLHNRAIDRDTFNRIFNDTENLTLISNFKIGVLKKLLEYFSMQHWQMLTPEQIVKICNNPMVKWDYLTDDQITGLNFKKMHMTQDIFNKIFPIDCSYGDTKNIIQRLELKQINSLLNYFLLDHWKMLTLEQIVDIHNYNDKMVQWKMLTPEQIVDIHNYNDQMVQWSYLSEDQIIKLDFGKIIMKQEIFNALPQIERIIQQLNHKQIERLSEVFSIQHWQMLTPEQIAQLDFWKITMTQKIFNALFPIHSSYGDTKKIIQQFNHEKIERLSEFFSIQHWQMLTLQQTLDLDYDKAKITQVKFQTLFSRPECPFKSFIEKFKIEKILTIPKYFSIEHWPLLWPEQILKIHNSDQKIEWQYLRSNQIAQLDYKQIKVTKEIFNTTFNKDNLNLKEKIKALTSRNIEILSDFFSIEHWQTLTLQQKLDLDYAKIQVTKEIFTAIVPWYQHSQLQMFQKFNHEQIEVLSKFFSMKYWQMLTPEQIVNIHNYNDKMVQWSYLSKDQIIKLDFLKFNMTQEIYNTLFPLDHPDSLALILQLKKEQLQALKPHFPDKHREYLLSLAPQT